MSKHVDRKYVGHILSREKMSLISTDLPDILCRNNPYNNIFLKIFIYNFL